MRGINHPSIVKLHQFFESEEHYFLVLERKCHGTDLTYGAGLNAFRSHGGRRALPPDREVDIFQ